MKTRSSETACTIENGSLCPKYAHLGNIAARTQSVLVYDENNQTFESNKEAGAFLMTYRSPGKYPTV